METNAAILPVENLMHGDIIPIRSDSEEWNELMSVCSVSWDMHETTIHGFLMLGRREASISVPAFTMTEVWNVEATV